MLRGIAIFCLLLGLAPGFSWAQDEADEMATGIGRPTLRGVTWGFTRTWWSRRGGDEGYPQAGTAGPTIGLRIWKATGARSGISPYIQYFWMNSTQTTLICDSCGLTRTDRTAFREIDLGLNFDYSFSPSGYGFYLGGGPLVRWGQSGSREVGSDRSGLTRKAAWFGVMIMGGYRSPIKSGAVVFFEPQLVLSPDLADRWQYAYPPNNLNLLMGILW